MITATVISNLVFLPIVAFSTQPSKGMTMAYAYCQDLQAENVSWYENSWPTTCCPDATQDYVPMSRDGVTSPISSGYLLWMNEPEFYTDPVSAARLYDGFSTSNPEVQVVAGNVNVQYTEWVSSFYKHITASHPEVLGIHVYPDIAGISLSQASQDLDTMHSISDSPIWITESGMCNGSVSDTQALVGLFKSKPYIERYSLFTNRQQGTEPWFYCSGVDLFTWNGQLTPIGQWYSEVK